MYAILVIILISIPFLNTPSSADVSGAAVSPCSIPSTSGLYPTSNPQAWPAIIPGTWIYVKGFGDVFYTESQNPASAWGKDTLDWMCGYTYGVHVPPGYNEGGNDYPLVVFLHGGLTNNPGGFHWLAFSGKFYVPTEDPYILVIPAKREWDWNAKKILDMVTDAKTNLRVDADRVYLTGLSMGGRGTFIVAAALPDQFAAIMPLSPHHAPFSYVPLAPKISHIPIWMSHGNADEVSSYDTAVGMKDALEQLGADITFNTLDGGKHCCWERVYTDPHAIEWLLSHKRSNRDTAVYTSTWGQIKYTLPGIR